MFWSRVGRNRALQEKKPAGNDHGLIARLVWSTLFRVSLVMLPLLAFVYVTLDAWNLVPVFDVPGAIVDLVKQLIVGMCVVLITYIGTYLLYRRHHEILTGGEIERISDHVAKQVIEAAGAAPLDEHLFRDGTNAHSLRGEHSELWISRESGSSLFSECAVQIKKLLQNGCRFKVVLTDPNGPGAAQTDLRNARDKGPVRTRSRTASAKIREILDSGKDHRGRFELRYTPYALPATAIIANPGLRLGTTKVIYRTIGHLTENVDQRMSLATDSERSPRLTHFIQIEFERIFRASSKVVLIPDSKQCTDWLSIFPSFFGRQSTGGFNSARLFLVIFDRGPDAAGRIHVRYGAAARAATVRIYATSPMQGRFSVSREAFVALRIAIDRAIEDKCTLLFGNLGPVALGDEAVVCDKTEISAYDVELPDTEHQAYVAAKLAGGVESLPMRLDEPILDLMNTRPDSHLYVHLAPLPGPGRAKRAGRAVDELTQQIRGHERTTVFADGATDSQLFEELRGSLRALDIGDLS